MIKRIDHVSIAVRDLDRARAFFVDGLGGKELSSCPSPTQKFRWTTIELGSSCLLELIDPLEEDGFVHRFLEKRGEGPHHLTFHVDDIRRTMRRLEERGIPTFGFSQDLPGWKEVFIRPKDAFGTLIQFAEFDPLDWVEQGYVPAAYREFLPPEKIDGEAGGPIEVRRHEAESGREIEIRRGRQTIRIPASEAGALIRALEQSAGGSAPPSGERNP